MAETWDTEDRSDLVSKPEGHIRDSEMYLTAALCKQVRETWGPGVTHVKTKTDVATGRVTVCRAAADEEGAVAIHMMKSQSTAHFSFFRPLRKLGMKVPGNRQLNVAPFIEEMANIGPVFIFPMNAIESVPRNRRAPKPQH